MKKQWIALLTALSLLIGSFLALFVPAAPPCREPPDTDGLIEPRTCSDTIYAVSASNLTEQETDTAICLQGLVNRVQPCLFILHDSVSRGYLDTFAKGGKTVVFADSDGSPWTLRTLIRQFRAYIAESGYTLYRESPFAEGLNTACNYATAYGYLAVPTELRALAEDAGLTLKVDLSKDTYNEAFLWKQYRILRTAFRDTAIVHVKTIFRGLRDLAIQQRFFITYSGTDFAGKQYLRRVLRSFGRNTAVLGWCEQEKDFVRTLSRAGCFVIPSDHSRNNSLISHIHFGTFHQKNDSAPIQADPQKHYAAILFSDGDNSQWVQNGYYEFFRKLALTEDFPMTWTFPPVQQSLSPVSMRRVYDAVGAQDRFIAGPSGIGYMNPSLFPADALDTFTKTTAAAAQKSDMRVVSILDDLPDAVHMPAFEKKLDYYTRFDTIDGGILMLDPDRYSSGHGRIWFSNDKPMLSVRLSLWYPKGENVDVPSEWIREQAERVNRYPADIHSINGYSLINVNPWTVSIDRLAAFVRELDDDVQLCTVEQLLALLAQNVPHQTAVPDLA